MLLLLLVSFGLSTVQAQPSLPSVTEQKEAMLVEPHISKRAVPPQGVRAAPGSVIDYWTYVVYQIGFQGLGEELFFEGLNTSTDLIPLASSPANEIDPRLNRTATAVVFSTDREKNYEIYRVNTDGSQVQRLTFDPAPEYWPDWSPDGARVVFFSGRNRTGNLYSMRADGSGLTQLTFDTKDSVMNIMPSWSPDGTQIAWVRRVQISKTAFERRLWVMGADGTNAHPITGVLPFLQHPVWSPDGARIAFDADLDGDGWNDLATIRPDGSNLVLRYKPLQPLRDAIVASWTPHGDALVFSEQSYFIFGGRLILSSTLFFRISMVQNTEPERVRFNASFAADVASTDPDPPQSRVLPLPPYSRASGFTVGWEARDRGLAWVEQAAIQYRPSGVSAWSDWTQRLYVEPVIADSAQYAGTPFYTARPAGQAWSAPVAIVANSAHAQLAVDAQGTLHLLVSDIAGTLVYRQLPRGGAWSAAENLGDGRDPLIAAGAQGQLHLTYICGHPTCTSGKVIYRQRASTGEWSASRAFLGEYLQYQNASLALGQDGTLYFAWEDGYSVTPGIWLVTRSVDGTWGGWERIVEGRSESSQLRIDTAGTLHLIWFMSESSRRVLFYQSRRVGEEWTPPLAVSASEYAGPLAVDDGGTVHVVQRDLAAGTVYYRKPPNGAWAASGALPITTYGERLLASSGAGQLALAWLDDPSNSSTLRVRTSVLAAGAGSGAISQLVSIPADLHAPTLSFMYRLQGATPANGTQLQVEVGQGPSAQTVFSATQSVDWTAAWVDLSPWAGQTISVTLRLAQAPNQVPAQLALDDIALGAWLTPVISGTTPAVPGLPGASRQLTIHGANFLATPAVRLGTTALSNVVWVNATTLQAMLPAGVRPGRYDLRVTNPGGQIAIRTDVLVGRETRLPLAVR